MTKQFIKSFLFTALTILFITSCGPSKEEQEKELKKEDSLGKIQSNDAIDRANALLNSDTAVVDSTKKSK